jgi:cephalosporin-C deacetylase-like acetyl esterase
MGYFEKDDIEVVVNYVNQHLNSTSIGIWGRSMGAVSALLYSSSHRTMDFVIAESPFASLRTLCVELVNSHTVKKIQKIPKIFASMLVTRLKKAVLKTANFDVE